MAGGLHLGFPLAQIGELLGLWQNRQRSSREVKALAEAHIAALDEKLKDLQAMRASLETLVHCCHGDERPDCPIIDSLASEAAGRGTNPLAASRKRPTG